MERYRFVGEIAYKNMKTKNTFYFNYSQEK